MKQRIAIALLLFTMFFSSGVRAEAGNVTSENLDTYFNGYAGTFVLFDEQNNEYAIYNEKQSIKRIPPCSSFKVFNSLIGLETGVIQDENTIIKWDGTIYPIASWDKDNTLASAISNSVIWYYKELAARVGNKRMQGFVDKIPYGNCDISGGATFWQTSSLKISAQEQVELLRKFYHYQLPFSPKNIDIVQRITVLSAKNDIVLSGKTGSGFKDGKEVIGWFIGSVEKDGNRYIFATNIEATDKATGIKAKKITLDILKSKGILDATF